MQNAFQEERLFPLIAHVSDELPVDGTEPAEHIFLRLLEDRRAVATSGILQARDTVLH